MNDSHTRNIHGRYRTANGLKDPSNTNRWIRCWHFSMRMPYGTFHPDTHSRGRPQHCRKPCWHTYTDCRTHVAHRSTTIGIEGLLIRHTSTHSQPYNIRTCACALPLRCWLVYSLMWANSSTALYAPHDVTPKTSYCERERRRRRLRCGQKMNTITNPLMRVCVWETQHACCAN